MKNPAPGDAGDVLTADVAPPPPPPPPPPVDAFDDLHQSLPAEFDHLLAIRLYRLSDEIACVGKLMFERHYGLRFTDVRIMTQLSLDDDISIREISRRANIDKAWISRLVRELEDKGLVTRKPDPGDSRAVMVALTESGRKLQKKMLQIALEHEAVMAQGVDYAVLNSSLDKFHDNIKMLQDRLR